MDENLIPDFDDDKAAKARGSLFNRLIQAILNNRWSTGWGLISEKGVNGGLISLDPNVIPGSDPIPYWRGKVTASSSSSADHTIEEVDADDVIIPESSGGRKTETAKAYNERKGVPTDTFVNVFEHPPKESTDYADYKFLIPDGQTASPADLTNTAVLADTTDWDVENQGSEDGADFDPSRTALSVPAIWFYDREMTVDSSGFVTKVGVERESFVAGDADDNHKDNHIALIDSTSGSADGKIVKLNEPQGLDSTVTFTLTAGANITIDGSAAASHTMTFDDSGRYRDGAQTIDYTIAAVAGAGDGQGYEDVHLNGVSQEAVTDGGIIDFRDDQTPSAGTQEVDWTVTGDAAGTATVKGEVDIDAFLKTVTDYDPNERQVLVNDSGTIQWETVAEITVVDDVTYDTSTGNLEQDKLTTVEVISGGTNSDNNLIEQAEDC